MSRKKWSSKNKFMIVLEGLRGQVPDKPNPVLQMA